MCRHLRHGRLWACHIYLALDLYVGLRAKNLFCQNSVYKTPPSNRFTVSKTTWSIPPSTTATARPSSILSANASEGSRAALNPDHLSQHKSPGHQLSTFSKDAAEGLAIYVYTSPRRFSDSLSQDRSNGGVQGLQQEQPPLP